MCASEVENKLFYTARLPLLAKKAPSEASNLIKPNELNPSPVIQSKHRVAIAPSSTTIEKELEPEPIEPHHLKLQCTPRDVFKSPTVAESSKGIETKTELKLLRCHGSVESHSVADFCALALPINISAAYNRPSLRHEGLCENKTSFSIVKTEESSEKMMVAIHTPNHSSKGLVSRHHVINIPGEYSSQEEWRNEEQKSNLRRCNSSIHNGTSTQVYSEEPEERHFSSVKSSTKKLNSSRVSLSEEEKWEKWDRERCAVLKRVKDDQGGLKGKTLQRSWSGFKTYQTHGLEKVNRRSVSWSEVTFEANGSLAGNAARALKSGEVKELCSPERMDAARLRVQNAARKLLEAQEKQNHLQKMAEQSEMKSQTPITKSIWEEISTLGIFFPVPTVASIFSH